MALTRLLAAAAAAGLAAAQTSYVPASRLLAGQRQFVTSGLLQFLGMWGWRGTRPSRDRHKATDALAPRRRRRPWIMGRAGPPRAARAVRRPWAWP